MADGVLYAVAGEILMKLSSQASQRLGMLCGLKDDLTKLTSNVSAIRAVLLDAEERPTKSRSLKDWLEKLGEALYDADDVLDEFSGEALHRQVMTRGKNAKQVRIFFSRSNQLAFNYKMAREIKKIRERLDVISTEKNNFQLNEIFEPRIQHDLFDQIGMKRETHSSLNGVEVIGREDDKMCLKNLLLDVNVKHNVSFVAIVGMGGIGKTTLAKFFYNNSEVSKFFELKMWVWVSGQFDVKVVMRKMIESATGKKPKVQEMDSLQCKLEKVITEKKYLLVMDDIWNESEEEWRKLKNLLMVGARGSKIMITKRDSKVVVEIESMTSLFTLKGLHGASSWSLFREVAFKEGKEPANQNLIQLGEEILAKCGGVPLVIRHIGRLLYSKTSEEEWISFKDNELLEVTQENNDMTSVLELSYNHLPSHLKQCFAYSSLFPKGKIIKINELIKQWMAQGFIKSSNGNKSMEDIGKDYFKELCWRFFYENSNDECNFNGFVNMHDVMLEIARKVAGKKLYVRGNAYREYDVSEQTRHISFDYEIKSWQDVLFKLHKAKGLRTFLLFSSCYKKNNDLDKDVLNELFSNFPRLRVLGLDGSNICEVPNSIKKLRRLRYLDLSKNEDLESLPDSITELQNLQTLNLMGCEFKELPRDTSNLVSLRHLDFAHRNMTYMPEGMEKLTCLQALNFLVFDYKRSNKLSKLNELNHLGGELRIIGLERLRCTTPSDQVSSVKNNILKNRKDLRDLTLGWKLSLQDECEKAKAVLADETIMEGLEPHPNVEYLTISGYSGVGLPNWVSNSLLKLTKIRIANCHRLQHLPQFNYLQALKTLHLEDLRCVKFIDKNDDYPSKFFPSLEFLWLKNMPNLERWWENIENKGLPPTFPQLKILQIHHCPNLTSIPTLASTEVNVSLRDVGVQMVRSIGSVCMLRVWSLSLREIKDLNYLPEELFQQNLSALPNIIHLTRLEIRECSNLMSLPEWIGNLTSLESLMIIQCPKLKSLPKGMQQLKSLQNLCIRDCPQLEERCKQGGEDWPKILHVPVIFDKTSTDESGTPESSSEAATRTAIIAETETRSWKMKDFTINIGPFFLTCGYEHSEP